ncbi:MAG: ribosome biogenesis GTPase Der, partial [Peptococcaceae bacterium]|nr:ribosome biogenesis GTPase Der [Peptococcaceae bacterium]
MKPIVAIVGRPNVGKSTLFNRLTRSKMAIVEDYPGVTRDRLYQDAEWNNRKFTLIDTGGIEVKSDDTILAQVRTQAQVAMEEADVIIFMCDIKAGVTNEDMEIAQMLRRTKKDVILAVNKVENFDHLEDLYEFYTLGLDEPYPISASHGMNTGDLLDRLMELIDKYEEEEYEPDVIKIAVVGRPNVGKSSLTNAILGQERAIVSNIPGTTRDAIDTPFERNGQQYVIIDTAGMRRKSKVAETTTERYSVIRSLRAVDRADAVLMVINAEEGLIEQDKKIVGYAHEQGKAIILVVNKWDLIEKDDKTSATMEKEIRSELLFLQYAPMIFVSAMTKQRVHKLIDMINFGVEQNNLRISTSVLNEVIRDAMQLNPPPS